jgi:virulence-associated protein VagC
MPSDTVTFASGNSIAVRLLADCKLPRGTRVREYREGRRIIIEPIDAWSDDFLAALGAWPEPIELPPRESPRDPFA